MNGRQAKFLRRKAQQLANRETEQMIAEFKKFVNMQLGLWERIVLAWRIIWKRF